MGDLRREVMVPVPSYKRPSSLIGISIVVVLLASAVDAVVWTYQARRAVQEQAIRDDAPASLTHTDAARIRRAMSEARADGRANHREVVRALERHLRDTGVRDDSLITVTRCDARDPLCGLE
jgi:hypothetical protein